MPATRFQRARVKFRVLLPWRQLFRNRTVRRTVQGVDLYLPWSHTLPDYARARSSYGQNLVELAVALAGDRGDELQLVDVGANVGDSALQVLNSVNGKALCVEGDEYWARYLRMNVEEDPRVTVEEVMLSPNATPAEALSPRRRFGTTSFVSDGREDQTTPWVSVDDLHDRNPGFARARLIKSDTDGFDSTLVPALARAWSQSGPVLFFEFDPKLAREVAGAAPERLWGELAELGYSRLAVWDNTGDPLGQLDVGEAPDAAAILDPPSPKLGYTFWDVAAAHVDDLEAAAAFDRLVGSGFDPSGSRSRGQAGLAGLAR